MTESNLLQPLVEAIETVKGRIAEHGQSLRENETRTRIALIDPILEALGWDVSNPKIVTPEFPVGSGRADYALLDDIGHGLVALEAKKLNDSLVPHRQQMVNYANMGGVGHAGLTDGDNWEIYKVFTATPLPLDQRLIMSVQLANTPTYEAALKLLILWRPNLQSGQPQEAVSPIVGTAVAKPDPPIIDPPPRDEGWVALEEFEWAKGTASPTAIRFPDNALHKVSSYRAMLIVVVDWLYASGKIRASEAPIRYGGGGIINDRPISQNDNEMTAPHPIGGVKLYIEVNGNAFRLLRRSKSLLNHFEIDLSTVHVLPKPK